MQQEFKLYWKCFAIFIVSMLILIVFGYALKPVDKAVERATIITSHQYKEGMQQRAAILEANIAEVNAQLRTIHGKHEREDLMAKRSALKAQLNAIIK